MQYPFLKGKRELLRKPVVEELPQFAKRHLQNAYIMLNNKTE